MKFSALPVHDLQDVTLDLEQLQALLTTPGKALPFLQLASAQQLQLAVGADNVTFTASTTSAVATVTHGIGRVPVFAGAFNNSGSALWFSVGTLTTTTANFFGQSFSALSATFPFLWVAIG